MKRLALAGGLTIAAAIAGAQVPAPTAEHEPLLTLAGDWTGGGPFLGGVVKGGLMCERFAGGFHVVCRARYDFTKEGAVRPYEEIALVGYSPEEKAYVWQGVNSFGWTPVGTIRGRRDPDGWTWAQETRENGQAVSYRWVFVQSQDRLAIKGTSTAAGAAPFVFADLLYTRPSPR